MSMRKWIHLKKVLTVLLDGFGIPDDNYNDFLESMNMAFLKKLWDEYPHSLLNASSIDVGLDYDCLKDDEIGYLTIGAGRVIRQLKDITNDFFDIEYKENETFQQLLLNKDKRIHLILMIGDGKNNSIFDDLLRFYSLLLNSGFELIYFHLIIDDGDGDGHMASQYISRLQNEISLRKIGNISTVIGSNYIFDQENFENARIYYDLLVNGLGIRVSSISKTIENHYQKEFTDGYIRPMIVNQGGLIDTGDIVVLLNHNIEKFKRIISCLHNLKIELYALYGDASIDVDSFLKKDKVDCSLGIYLSKLGINQARVATTSNMIKITKWLDGDYGFKNSIYEKIEILEPEDTLSIQKEKYAKITEETIELMEKDIEFIVVSYPTCDFQADFSGLDDNIRTITRSAEENFYKIIIVSDRCFRGFRDGSKLTDLVIEKVPFILMDKKIKLDATGVISSFAPTVLTYLDIAIPQEMRGTPVLINKN